MIPAGRRPHEVFFMTPSTVLDGVGGYEEVFALLTPPKMRVEIRRATVQDMSNRIAGTVISEATHIIAGPFHRTLKTQDRILFNDRTFAVLGLVDEEERGIEMEVYCSEVVNPELAAPTPGPPTPTILAVPLLVDELGGSYTAFLTPSAPDVYPAGSLYSALVPGSWTILLQGSDLPPAGVYVFEASARVSDLAGARAKVALIDLSDDSIVAELIFTVDEITGERKRSGAITFAAAETLYGVKVTTDDIAVQGAAWGCRILRV